jgi:putative SOS response-associated peptidase YedK
MQLTQCVHAEHLSTAQIIKVGFSSESRPGIDCRLLSQRTEWRLLRGRLDENEPRHNCAFALRPVINFRSEGRRFPLGRCLVPASFFYEFTGTKSPKSKWRFTMIGEDWFSFAGLWRLLPQGGAAFTLLTTDPSDDVALSTTGKW